MKLAVQLYSVRDGIADGEDMLEALGKVKEIGFDGVEFAGYFGLDAEALAARLSELGLVCIGTHTGLDKLKADALEETIAYHKTIGCKNIGIGGGPHSTIEECEATAAVLGFAAQRAARDGIKIYYHNHTEEFTPFANGKTAMEMFAEACSLEVDTYWSFCAGVDNYKYITENKNDIILLHIKDGVDRHPMALGEGECDLKAVIDGAKAAGIEWLVLENDDPEPDGISDITRSMKYLKANI